MLFEPIYQDPPPFLDVHTELALWRTKIEHDSFGIAEAERASFILNRLNNQVQKLVDFEGVV